MLFGCILCGKGEIIWQICELFVCPVFILLSTLLVSFIILAKFCPKNSQKINYFNFSQYNGNNGTFNNLICICLDE